MMKATKTWVLIVLLLIPAINVHAWPIPDTGQTKCYNNTVVIACPTPGQSFYGQDGNYNFNPHSYTKLDANGNALPTSAPTWAMVKDNVTGLIWENKTDDGGIHDKDNTYVWAGTDAFIKALNDAQFGGFTDWRMPTIKELSSLINISVTDPGPTIDTAWFPNTVPSSYWSSTINANNTSSAWYVGFNLAYIAIQWNYNSYYVRAVRGAQPGSLSHLVDNSDGTVTDTETGLMWQKFTAPSAYKWEQALAYAETLKLAGHSDWRLPNRNELQSLVDYSQWYPAIDPLLAPHTVSSYYWSSTTDVNNKGDNNDITSAWHVAFESGTIFYVGLKNWSYYVRAVRTAQSMNKKVGLPWLQLLLGD
jgi:hypothetical protein